MAGRDAQSTAKGALEMAGAHAHGACKLVQADRFASACREMACRLLDERLVADDSVSRTAAAARTKTLALGGAGISEEDDLAALGPPRGTRRPAVDSGRKHGENEVSVAARIPREDGAPTGAGREMLNRCAR